MNEEIIQQTAAEAKALLAKGKTTDALPLIRQAAHWGSVDMQKLAADLYRTGTDGILPDPEQTFLYDRLAALNGNAESMYHLGLAFQKKQQKDKAMHFLQRALDAGETRAADPLAMLVLMEKRDVQTALKLLEQADQNDRQVQKHIRMAQLLQKKLDQQA